jgi:hypothetical protein
MVEVSTVVCGKLGVKRKHNHSCSRDLKILVNLNDIVPAFGIFGVSDHIPAASRGVFPVNHTCFVDPKVNASKN